MTNLLPVHFPLRDLRSKGIGEARETAAICCCGHGGPWVTVISAATPALVQEHGATEPRACADCGAVCAPQPDMEPNAQAPWRRYSPVESTGEEWRFVCRDRAACRQRLRSEKRGDDPLTAVVGTPDTVTSTLNLSGDLIQTMSLSETVAAFQLAQARSPRTWIEISPRDLHPLLALVSAAMALRDTATDALMYVIPTALKAGATWAELAEMSGFDCAEDLRTWHLETVQSLDWPPEQTAEIEALLATPADDG